MSNKGSFQPSATRTADTQVAIQAIGVRRHAKDSRRTCRSLHLKARGTGDKRFSIIEHVVAIALCSAPFFFASHISSAAELLVFPQLGHYKLIPGHIEAGWELDGEADLAHTRDYLSLFTEKVTCAPGKLRVHKLIEYLQNAFHGEESLLDTFFNHLPNQFGEDGQVRESGSRSRIM